MEMMNFCAQERARTDGVLTVIDVLRQIPLDQLDCRVQRFKTRVPYSDLQNALVHRIGMAPEEEFGQLQAIYMKHFSDSAATP